MKKGKRILAILGIILLAVLYLSTLIFALIGSKDTMVYFKASIYATVVIPVLIWAYTLVYKLLKDHYSLRNDIRPAGKDGKIANGTDSAAKSTDDASEDITE